MNIIKRIKITKSINTIKHDNIMKRNLHKEVYFMLFAVCTVDVT